MKKWMIVIGLLLINIAVACAYPNEPDGYEGHKWGEELNNFSGLIYSGKFAREDEFYIVKGKHELLIGDKSVYADRIGYGFYKDRFVGVMAEVDAGDCQIAVNEFYRLHGAPTNGSPESGVTWIGEKSVVGAAYRKSPEPCIIMLHSLQLR